MSKHFTPRPYQVHAINHLIQNPVSGLLLEMGLGKTISTLTAIDELKYNRFLIGKVLIVAPLKVARDTWPDEIDKWIHTSGLTYASIIGPKKKRLAALQQEADVYLINRENIVWLIEQYGRYTNKQRKTSFVLTEPWPFDTLVLDELSNYKDQSTRRFKMLKKIRPYFNRVIGLTGTPAPNSLIDLWAQIYLLDQGERLGKTEKAYRERYFVPGGYIRAGNGQLITPKSKWELAPGSEEAIYSKIGDICISMKTVDHLGLPEMTFKDIKIEMSAAEKKMYKELEREFVLELEDEVIDAQSAASLSSKLHQLAQGAIYTNEEHDWTKTHNRKLDALDELIEEAQGKSVLVFYHFKHDRERLRERFPHARDLTTTQDMKDWNEGRIPLLLAHPQSAGHGLNLQFGGHIIVWYCMTWSLELYQQANKRLHRPGQNNYVSINRIIMKDTVDERIIDVLDEKAQRQDALMEAVKVAIEESRGGR